LLVNNTLYLQLVTPARRSRRSLKESRDAKPFEDFSNLVVGKASNVDRREEAIVVYYFSHDFIDHFLKSVTLCVFIVGLICPFAQAARGQESGRPNPQTATMVGVARKIRTLPGSLFLESSAGLYRVQTLQYADGAFAFARDSQFSECLARNFTLGRQRPCASHPASTCCG
jgi:hypothetical protein